MILLTHLVRGCAGTHFKGWLEQSTQVDIGRLGRAQRVVDGEKIRTTNHFVYGTQTKLGHDRAQLF